MTHWALTEGIDRVANADNVARDSKPTDKYEDFMIFAGGNLKDYYTITIANSGNLLIIDLSGQFGFEVGSMYLYDYFIAINRFTGLSTNQIVRSRQQLRSIEC
jgi:hypothetical protein